MTEDEFLRRVKSIGGRAYLVGGCVRDEMRGVVPHDRDIVVVGASREAMERAFEGAAPVGRQFPVYRLFIDGSFVEVALARRDRKTAPGHDGFVIEHSPDITIEEDLFRRDITINAAARDIETGEVIDPYGAARDIECGVIRAVSRHFAEDPLRALRAARFAAVLGHEIEPETIRMMRECGSEVTALSDMRVVGELERALAAPRPSVFFRELVRAELLDAAFPEIAALIGKSQPEEHHPEGDAFEHTMQIIDAVSERTESLKTRFAALMHDIGKGATPTDMLPHHYGHDERGAAIVSALPSAYRREWKRAAAACAAEHMRAALARRPGKQTDVLEHAERSGLGAEGLGLIVELDAGHRPYYLTSDAAKKVLARVELPPDMRDVRRIKEHIRGARIRRLIELRGDAAL